MPMLNVRIMSSIGTPPLSLQPREQRRDRATRGVDHARPYRAGSTRGRFSVMPPPVMCAMPLIRPAASSGCTSGR